MSTKDRTRLLAAIVVGAMLALPGLAVANHTTCDKQSNEVGPGQNCPEFSPDISGSNVSNRVVDSESTLNYEIGQADHESSTMLVEAYAPKGWQLNTQILGADGPDLDLLPDALATGCTEANAEAISGNQWRLRSLAGTARTATDRTGAAYFGRYDSGTQTIHGCARLNPGSITLPFTVSKLPAAATHGWKITINTRPFIESIASSQGSMTRLAFDLNQRTSGTWHKNLSGQPERAIFSQASATPVTTDLRADLTTCRRGLDPLTATGCRGDLTLVKTVAGAPFNISPAPQVAPMDFARLTGPGRLPGTTAEKVGPVRREGFGLVEGSTTANVTFTQPSAHPDETVKGYALVVAIPNDQGSRSGKYVVTKAGEPGFNATVCGATGTSASCSIPLVAGSLPRVDGNGSLHPDFDAGGKYDVALVTIFMSGKRSDGNCDDGTVFGTMCAAATPLWEFKNTFFLGSGCSGGTIARLPQNAFGISTWQFLWRTHDYGSTSVENMLQFNGFSGAAGCRGNDDETEPFLVLFVDYATKEAEFVIYGGYTIARTKWCESLLTGICLTGTPQNSVTNYIEHTNSGDGEATSFRSRDNRIIGDGDTGSVQFTNGASPTGTAMRFDYTGETDPSGTFGLVTLYDPGDVNLGPNVPPSPSVRRPTMVAYEFMEGGAI